MRYLKIIRALTTVLGVSALLLACSFAIAQDVKTNYMPGTDFSVYKTYKWVTIEGARYPNQILDQQIKDAVNSQLTAKGFTVAIGEKADLYVAYQVAVQNQQQWNAYGMGGVRWGGGMGTATSSTIQIGTLDVDFYDPAQQKLLWQGSATKTLNPSKDPAKNQARLHQAVAKLLKSFPPGAGK
jgi:hypothetical protein